MIDSSAKNTATVQEEGLNVTLTDDADPESFGCPEFESTANGQKTRREPWGALVPVSIAFQGVDLVNVNFEFGRRHNACLMNPSMMGREAFGKISNHHFTIKYGETIKIVDHSSNGTLVKDEKHAPHLIGRGKSEPLRNNDLFAFFMTSNGQCTNLSCERILRTLSQL